MDEKLKAIIDGFAEGAEEILGDNLVSLFLYGSAAAGDYVPGRSDINFLLVAASADEETLTSLVKHCHKYQKRGVATPFVMDVDDLGRSVDAFPLEFLEMKNYGRLIKGEDLLAGMVIDAEDLRLQLEREIKGKLIQLRKSYIRIGDDKKGREELFRESIKSFMAIVRGMLWLEGIEPVPREGQAAVAGLEKIMDRSMPHMAKVLEYKTEKPKLAETEVHRLFAGYLDEVETMADWIDEWVEKQEDEK